MITTLKFLIETCRLVALSKSTYDQTKKVAHLLYEMYELYNETDVGPEL